jgi:hypothetical protein
MDRGLVWLWGYEGRLGQQDLHVGYFSCGTAIRYLNSLVLETTIISGQKML